MPSLLNGSDLSTEEFRDSVRLRFGLMPKALPPRCDGCGERFTTEHAMSCRKGGLILHRHNDLVATWGQLCGQAHTHSKVSDNPLSKPVRTCRLQGRTAPSPPQNSEATVPSTGSGPEAPPRSSMSKSQIRMPHRIATLPRTRFSNHEKEKKDKYGAVVVFPYREYHKGAYRTFTPLVFLVDGLQGAEATNASWRLAFSLVSKWKRSYSEICGFVRSASRLPSFALRAAASGLIEPDAQNLLPMWDCGKSLGLYRM